MPPALPPRHIAVIMDGNGRWARNRGLPRLAGHHEGSKAVGECVEGAKEAGVEFLTLYAFSAENWKRPADEVMGLMGLLERFLDEKTAEMVEKGIRLRAIGRLDDLPPAGRERLERSMEATKANSRLTVVLALSYAGRVEIVDAAKSLARDAREGRLHEVEIDADLFTSRLYTKEFPDPDLVIRTSGEMRISNFLLWQLSYSELYITPKLWPDFRKADLLEAIADYGNRHRRYGGI